MRVSGESDHDELAGRGEGTGREWVKKVAPPLALPGVTDWADWGGRVSGLGPSSSSLHALKAEGADALKGTPWGTALDVEAKIGRAKADVSDFVAADVDSGLVVKIAEQFVAVAEVVEDVVSGLERRVGWVAEGARDYPVVAVAFGVPLAVALVGPLRREALFRVRALGKTEEQVVGQWREAAEAALVRVKEADGALQAARSMSDASLARYALAVDGVREDATPLRAAVAEFRKASAAVARLEAAGERREWRENEAVMQLVRKLGEERTRVATAQLRDSRLKGIEDILRKAPPVPFVHHA